MGWPDAYLVEWFGTDDYQAICEEMGVPGSTIDNWLGFYPAYLKKFYFVIASEFGIEPGRIMIWHHAQHYLHRNDEEEGLDRVEALVEVDSRLPKIDLEFKEYITA